jgi:hypothetical protein
MGSYFRRLFARDSEDSKGAAVSTIPEASEPLCFRRCDLVEKRAMLLWNAEGCVPGREFYCRLRAEEEIAAELGERQIS